MLHRQSIHYDGGTILKSVQKQSFQHIHHQIFSFCTQIKKEQQEEPVTEKNNKQTIVGDDDQTQQEDEEEDDEEYEYEYDESEEEEEEETEEEEEEEEEEVEQQATHDDDEIDDTDEEEYEYEYETDDEYEEYDEEDEERISMDQTPSEISENFDFLSDADSVIHALFAKLPESGRLKSKPVEHFVSPLILQPLEVLNDDIHNKFTLMHRDLSGLKFKAYKLSMEQESDLRDLIQLAFKKLHIYSNYIEQHFELRHSPKHYLMRQLRRDHGHVVFLAMRKIMYHKYPQWVQNDNWATFEMAKKHNLFGSGKKDKLESVHQDEAENQEGADIDGGEETVNTTENAETETKEQETWQKLMYILTRTLPEIASLDSM